MLHSSLLRVSFLFLCEFLRCSQLILNFTPFAQTGLTGLLGYTADGILKQWDKIGHISAKDHIRVSRLTQGFDEMQQISPEKQAEILERWHNLQLERKRKGKKRAVNT